MVIAVRNIKHSFAMRKLAGRRFKETHHFPSAIADRIGVWLPEHTETRACKICHVWGILQKSAPPKEIKLLQNLKKTKVKLCTAEVWRRSNSALPYVLTTDWSQKGMGAVLGQIDEEGNKHLVSHFSRSCNPAEKNYGSCEWECLALVWAN